MKVAVNPALLELVARIERSKELEVFNQNPKKHPKIVKCVICGKGIHLDETNETKGVRNPRNLWVHEDCQELKDWKKTSKTWKNKIRGKAGHAANGRVIKSSRGL